MESEGGFGLGISYGITPSFARTAGFDFATMDFADAGTSRFFGGQYEPAQVDLGARYHFVGQTRWMPYVEGMLTGLGVAVDAGGDDLTMNGGGAALGGGLQYLVSRKFGLNDGLRYTFGSLTNLNTGARPRAIPSFPPPERRPRGTGMGGNARGSGRFTRSPRQA